MGVMTSSMKGPGPRRAWVRLPARAGRRQRDRGVRGQDPAAAWGSSERGPAGGRPQVSQPSGVSSGWGSPHRHSRAPGPPPAVRPPRARPARRAGWPDDAGEQHLLVGRSRRSAPFLGRGRPPA